MPDVNLPVEPPGTPPTRTASDWKWWTEVVSAALLGLAAVGAGWAAYQSSLWNSRAIFAITDANEAARDAMVLEVKALQLATIDVGVFLQYLDALSRHDERLANFIYQRVRPEMKPALDAWLATRPLLNPKAPRTPFVMKEYRLRSDQEAERFTRTYFDHIDTARDANKLADKYVLLTVPFAIVSLLSGLSTRFPSPVTTAALVVLALAVFIFGAVNLASMPRTV